MAAEDALLQACRWAPDDDAPRLVWADAVGGERGELVVIQCDLARGDLAPAEAGARRRRERELLAAHGAAWAGLDGFHGRYELRRGFVEAIELDARTFAAHGEEIFARAPLLRSLTAGGLTTTSDDPLEILRVLLDSPAFWQLHALDLVHIGAQTQAFDYDPGFDGRGDEAARLLAGSGAIAHLDALGISSSGLTAAGVHHLVASGELQHLERLRLRDHALGGDAILAVLARAPQVLSLDLDGITDLEVIVPALPPVTELHLSEVGDGAFAALRRSRAAATLERLRLSRTLLELDDRFSAFPRLRALDLQTSWVMDLTPDARAIATALPALRQLRLSSSASANEVLRIGRALGPQLEQLDVRDHAYQPGLVDMLRPHVAGELLAGEPDAEWLPL